MRFLLSRRWVLFALVVAALAWVAVQLGQWQFGRLEQRQQDNRIVSTNLGLSPTPYDDLLSTQRQPRPEDEWRRVTVRGRWDDERTVVLKYQTRDQGAGVDVVTPLVTDSGVAVLVNRGWMATDNSGAARPELPEVTDGEVTVTGWVRRDATGSAAAVSDLSTRAISSERIAEVVPYPLYRGFLDLAEQSPAPVAPLAPRDLPDAGSNGPHFFYGLQWWFFGALAVFGFFYLAWDEVRQRREGGAGTGRRRRSQRAQHAPVDREHHAGHER